MDTSSYRCRVETSCAFCRRKIRVGERTRQPVGRPARHERCFSREFPPPDCGGAEPPTPGPSDGITREQTEAALATVDPTQRRRPRPPRRGGYT